MRTQLRDWLRKGYLAFLGLSTYYERQRILKRFFVERGLIHGTHRHEAQQTSIIHFSVNKAASQYVKRILRRCAEENAMAVARFDGYSFHSNFPYLHTLTASEMSRFQHIFRPRGYLYTVFGGMVEGIPQLENYRVLLLVRDPRDVLTSRYYSVAHSHPVPLVPTKRIAFEKDRMCARKIGIDQYVLNEMQQVKATYERYRRLLVPLENVHITKYEEMVDDFEQWLEKLLRHCGLEVSPELREQFRAEARATRSRQEDPTSHVRQITPGDHRRKLKSETIQKLNQTLRDELDCFGYGEPH
ncbi:MAG: sulfotransferase domain-containing protein [Gemmataceae bacterium]